MLNYSTEPNNLQRASWAEKALRYYVKTVKHDASHRDDLPDEIADLLSDIMHLARAKGLDPKELVERAVGCFDIEEKEGASHA